MSYVDLREVIYRMDSLLRHRKGIWDFTDDRNCLFRISLITSELDICLSDGTQIANGDPLIELHFWNEHLPVMPSAGPSIAWAVRLSRQMHNSLALLDRYLEHEPSLNGVAALTGSPPFGSRLGEIQMARTGRRFGFEIVEPDPEWGDGVHMVFDSMLLWGLGWAYNRPGLRGKRWLRHRYHLWISRTALRGRFRDAEASAVGRRH